MIMKNLGCLVGEIHCERTAHAVLYTGCVCLSKSTKYRCRMKKTISVLLKVNWAVCVT
jgi:hypothetical protein